MYWGQRENGGDNKISHFPLQHPAQSSASYSWGECLSSRLLIHFSQLLSHRFLQSIFWVNPSFVIPATTTLTPTVTTSHVDHRASPLGFWTPGLTLICWFFFSFVWISSFNSHGLQTSGHRNFQLWTKVSCVSYPRPCWSLATPSYHIREISVSAVSSLPTTTGDRLSSRNPLPSFLSFVTPCCIF